MYDHFNDLVDNRDIIRPALTSYYWLGEDPGELRERFVVPRYDRDKNFVFEDERGMSRFYLLKRNQPDIGITVKRLRAPAPGWGYTPPFGLFDVVFISNGEPNEEAHYAQLASRQLGDRLHWVRNVKGRTQAYQAAARASRTHHFFAVFGKLAIDPSFTFDFPIHDWDRSHYVFTARNPVNGLCYGHQGLILYDKEQVLANPGTSLDFTMGQLYRSLDIVSGTAHYNTSALAAWRTAFREVLKLLHYASPITQGYVERWKTGAGPHAADSIQGALDAQAFYDEHQGDPDVLQQSYEWAWLEARFKK